ncbi:MAG: trypsin-like serine protease, partial [Chloroflexi bacterium]|nr:trypsin-like serine protease [Chloroflexota bacterium]
MKRRAWMLVMSLLAVTLAVMHTSVGLAAHLLTESPVIPERSNPNNETLHIIDAPVSVLPAVDDEGLPDKTLQTVIAPDERIRIADTTAFPYNAMAYLEIDGGKASCSGAFVGLRVLLTAAHCLYDSDGSGFLDSIRVVPGKNGSSEPFGSQFGSVVRIPLQWRRSVDTGRANQQWDWGLVLLPNEDLGKRVGKLTVGVLQTATLKGADFNPVTSGYPGDKSRGTLWATSKPKLIDALPDYLVHDMDVYPGQSGSP